MNYDDWSLEEKAERYAYLLMELGLVLGYMDILDTSFDSDKFLEEKKQKYIEKHLDNDK